MLLVRNCYKLNCEIWIGRTVQFERSESRSECIAKGLSLYAGSQACLISMVWFVGSLILLSWLYLNYSSWILLCIGWDSSLTTSFVSPGGNMESQNKVWGWLRDRSLATGTYYIQHATELLRLHWFAFIPFLDGILDYSAHTTKNLF